MSECITHTAIVDDCMRLIAAVPAVNHHFKATARDHLEMARLGGITRHGDRHNPGLLEQYRDACDRGDYDRVASKLAFVLGWLSHRAADRQMKKVFRDVDPDCPRSPRDCSVYHDVCVFREVYGGGSEPFPAAVLEPDLASHPAAAVCTADLEDALQVIWRRMLIRFHTFIPDDHEPDVWLDGVVRARQDLYVDLKRYAEAYTHPEPELVKRFVTEVNFYNAQDLLLQALQALRRGKGSAGIDLEAALSAAASGCLYGRAAARAFGYVRAADAYFRREIDRDELEARLEIGRPELSG